MEVGTSKINYSFAFAILDVGIGDIPFLRNGPVKNLRTARHFVDLQWDEPLQDLQRLTHTIAGQVIVSREVTGAVFPLLGESVTLGRERGEINFPDDGYVSGLHARVTLRDGRVFLADLGSSNGTFVKVNGERGVGHESFVLLGQQLFRLNFNG